MFETDGIDARRLAAANGGGIGMVATGNALVGFGGGQAKEVQDADSHAATEAVYVAVVKTIKDCGRR